MKNFYKKFKKPFYALAPLAGITDSAFRQMCKSFGADLVYSEMASATALYYGSQNKNHKSYAATLDLIKFNEVERPYVVQLFGAEPKHFTVAAKIISSEKSVRPLASGRTADGIDINFGCPVPKVVKQRAGIALFQDLKRSREVIKSVIDSTDLPVSLKTRSRVKEVDVLQFLDYMKDLDIKAVMIHGRSGSQGFSGPVDTGIIKKASDYFGGVIIANGGVIDYDSAKKLLADTKADGVAIGQGAMGRPWIFGVLKDSKCPIEHLESKGHILKTALEHAKLAERLKGEQGVIEMRKHLCWYVKGLPGSREMRQELVKVETINDIKEIIKSYNLQPIT